MVWCRIMDCFVRRMILSHHPAATVMLYSGLLILSIAMVNASQSGKTYFFFFLFFSPRLFFVCLFEKNGHHKVELLTWQRDVVGAGM